MKLKRFLSVIALLLAAVIMCGCGGSKDPKDTEEAGTTDSSADTTTADKEDVDTVNVYSGILTESGEYDVKATDIVKVTMADVKGIVIPKEIHTPSDDEMTVAVASILCELADSSVKLDREVRLGDTVNVDYVGSVNGVEFEGGSTGGNGTDVVIGVTSYIDDFLYQLIGHKPGDVVNVNVTFPEDYGKEELNGKDALFVTTINYISYTPELTDELVKGELAHYGYQSAAELRSALADSMSADAINTYITTYLISKCAEADIPQSILDYQVGIMLDYYRGYAESYAMGLDEFVEYAYGITKDQLISDMKPQCVEVAKYSLACQAVAELVGIEVKDADLTEYFTKYYNTSDYSSYATYYGLPYLKQMVLSELVMEYVIENSVKG